MRQNYKLYLTLNEKTVKNLNKVKFRTYKVDLIMIGRKITLIYDCNLLNFYAAI